jgi:hypothetical protein
MIEFFTAPGVMVFSVAFGLMVLIVFLEFVSAICGFALSGIVDNLFPDFDTGIDIDPDVEIPLFTRIFGWIRIKNVPFLILFVLFLLSFSSFGFILQHFFYKIFKFYIIWWVVLLPSLILSFGFVRGAGAIIGRFVIRDESSAVSEKSLIGKAAYITIGTASQNDPTEAKVQDEHGSTHLIMVEPRDDITLKGGEKLYLIRKEGSVFKAVKADQEVTI